MAVKNKKEKVTLENLAVNQIGLTKTADRIAKTVENLTQEMRGGFAETKKEIENLAVITKHGFDEMDERFKSVDERFDKLGKTNTREHEEMSLRLDNACPVK